MLSPHLTQYKRRSCALQSDRRANQAEYYSLSTFLHTDTPVRRFQAEFSSVQTRPRAAQPDQSAQPCTARTGPHRSKTEPPRRDPRSPHQSVLVEKSPAQARAGPNRPIPFTSPALTEQRARGKPILSGRHHGPRFVLTSAR